MSAPDWRRAIAADSITDVRMLHHEDGRVSIKVSMGAISAVALVSAADFAFLATRPATADERSAA